jgi:hypothetical protein
MAIESVPAVPTATPAAPLVRAPVSRWRYTVAGARWFERGTRGRDGTRAGSDAAVTSCARRFGSEWWTRAWWRWCAPVTRATRRVLLDAAEVGCTAAGRETGVACASGARETAPASTIEAITSRVGGLTSRSIDGWTTRYIRNAQSPAGFPVNCVGRSRMRANPRFH